MTVSWRDQGATGDDPVAIGRLLDFDPAKFV